MLFLYLLFSKVFLLSTWHILLEESSPWFQMTFQIQKTSILPCVHQPWEFHPKVSFLSNLELAFLWPQGYDLRIISQCLITIKGNMQEKRATCCLPELGIFISSPESGTPPIPLLMQIIRSCWHLEAQTPNTGVFSLYGPSQHLERK